MNRHRASLAFAVLAATLLLTTGQAAAQDPAITVDPSADLADGDTVTVTASGFPASGTAFISGQCVTPVEDPLAQCDVAGAIPVALDANGEATFDLVVKTGPIGDGNCGFDQDDCIVLVGSITQPDIFAAAPITFAQEELALTGPTTNLLTLFVIGAALLTLGLGAVVGSRRSSPQLA